MADTTIRSNAPELMDDFSMEGDILSDALEKIAHINRLLGGNSITLDGIKQLIEGQPAGAIIRITDIGCGNGDMLRALADYAAKRGLHFVLVGIDANAYTVAQAAKLSAAYANISYAQLDILQDSAKLAESDIFLCTLTLHHFRDSEILDLLRRLQQLAGLGIVINDLQRSNLAYQLFRVLCFLFRLNDMSREDGLVSILRGFKKADLRSYSKEMKLTNYKITWKWAFRYQWIVKTR